MPHASIAYRRLDVQGLTRARFRRPQDVVSWFGAVQAQEFAPARWALGLRLHGRATDADVANAFDAGRILRTHVMRPTWHFVAAEDIIWLQALTAPRVQRIAAGYNRRLGLDARTLARGTTIVERALRDRQYRLRGELKLELERRGLSLDGQRLAHLMMHTELEGVVCSGPRRGTQSTYGLIGERVLRPRRLTGDEALAELTLRFFRSHGPATIRDFVWWSGLTSADAKRGLEMNRATREEIGGLRYWRIGRSRSPDGVHAAVQLLPIYDEYLVAYRDRAAVPHLVPQTSAESLLRNFQHALVIDGQVAGTWRTASERSAVGVMVYPVRRLTATERRELTDVVERYGRFARAPVRLEVHAAIADQAS